MIDNLQTALPLWEQWWNRENQGALPYVIFPAGDVAKVRPFVKDWMPEKVVGAWSHWTPELLGALALEKYLENGNPAPIEEWLDFMEAYAELYGHAGAGFRFLLPGLGPACMAVFLSGYFKYFEPTVWAEAPEPMSFEEIVEGIDKPSPRVAAYRQGALLLFRRVAERLGGTYLIGMADLGDGMDALAPLRHNSNLLMDLYDEPEELHRVRLRVSQFADEIFNQLSAIIDPVNGGATACVMRYLSAKPSYLTFCDFSAMIGPDMFEEFVLPTVRHHCERFPGRTVYHLDGVGELPHVQHLCEIDELFAVQWVQGAGKPQPTDPGWDDLYHQLLDAGKRICIGWSNPDDLRALFKRFPASEFTVNAKAVDAQHAQAIIEICE